ncbi:MAG: T9SS type A sorting domain-containing protein [candidate division Zixibacteria bacterium]|nr:T9SS type A sorting domain-containing protein [candidate division Zixibacteria bacterium]
MIKKLISLLFIITVLFWASDSFARMPKGYEHLKPVPNVWLTPDDFSQVTPPHRLFDTDDTINVRINTDNSGQLQNEQQIWINPTDNQNVVAVWRDFRLGYRRLGYGYSFDGGETWTDALFPNEQQPRMSDPCLTYDVDGNFYALSLSFDWNGQYSGFEVFKSIDGGMSWEDPVWAILSDEEVFEDKEMFTCDRAPDSPYQGNLYIAWTRFSDNQRRTDCMFIRSTDGGQVWGDSIIVSDQTSLQWPLPVVGAGGELYVAWVSYRNSSILFDRSSDGGLTWGNDIVAANVYTPSTEINGGIFVFSFPAMDTDITGGENHGNIYLAYMDRTIYDFDIYFRKSTDSGESWSDEIRINDDEWDNGCDQFHPWLTVDENGVITVMFYDRRNDEQHNLLYDIYYTQSFDAGETWTTNERVTTVSSDPSQGLILAGLIGEYSGVSLKDGWANFVWTDWRDGDQNTYAARIQTYDPTSVREDEEILPTQPILISNYPNPFNASTAINFNVPVESEIEISAFDVSGRKVAEIVSGEYQPGSHSVNWDAEELASGVYFVRLQTDDASSTRKVALIK